MGKYPRVMPDHYRDFLDDYIAICKKHGLMIFSDGESVEVGSANDDLWRIEEGTLDRIEQYGVDEASK